MNDYFLFGFAGHGVSSRAMHYYAVSDHLVLLFQKGFGNGQKNTTKERDEVNGVFYSAKFFFEAIKEAVDKGKFLRGVVLLSSSATPREAVGAGLMGLREKFQKVTGM